MSTHIKFCTKIEKERTEWTVYYIISTHILISRILLSFHQKPENFIAVGNTADYDTLVNIYYSYGSRQVTGKWCVGKRLSK